MSSTTYPERHAPAADVDAILRLHREWWEANLAFDIPRMQTVFPSPGEEYLMFNLNGHPYVGMDEKTKLWEFYAPLLGTAHGYDVRIMRLEVDGDTAWLACEGRFDWDQPEGDAWTADDVDTPWLRATEIYRRNDGGGNPEWRMWHTHISPAPIPTEPRPAFEDSTESRGLGVVPWAPIPTRDA